MRFVCGSCGAGLMLEGRLRTAVCAFCGAPSVVERPASEGGAHPVFVLGFVRPEAAVRGEVARWLKARSVFCVSGVRRASVGALQAVYVPAYLYSAVARSEYRARIGEHYTVVERYTTVENGRTVQRTRTRTETEWRPLSGPHAANVVDVLVTASRGLSNAELEAVEPFDWRALRRYRPAMISGWPAEEPSLSPEECLTHARTEARALTDRRLQAFMPGDTHRDLAHTTALEEETLDLVLVPLWLLAVRYAGDRPPLRIVVNGQTGEIHGRPPLSWAKVSAAVLAALLAVLALWLLIRGRP